MKFFGWLGPCLLGLLAGALRAGPPPYVIATAAGYIPGATPIALQQHLVQPVVVAYDPNGTLYYGTLHQVWRLNPDATATLLAGISSTGTAAGGNLGDGGPGTSATLTWVSGLAVDAQQNLYISDLLACEIRKLTPAGIITRFAGTGASPSYGAQSNASSSTPAQKVPLTPGSLAIDTTNLYASDSATSSVLAFPFDGRSSRIVAGNHGTETTGDGGPAATASLFYPGTLALSAGILYINEAAGARIRQVALRTGVITTLIQLAQTYLTDNGNPGLAADSDGAVYLQQGNVINRFYPKSPAPQPWAGGGKSPPGDSGPPLQASLLAPASLAVNPVTHDVALADLNGNLVQTVSVDANLIQTVAGYVHFAGDGGPAAMAIFNGMESVVSDSQGNLYIADVGNNRIRKIDASGIVTTIAGTGVVGFSGDHGPALAATLDLRHSAPFASNLAIDPSGNLYFSDFGNGRIRKIDTNGIITTVAGGGNALMVRGSLALNSSLEPGPLAVDSAGNIYFANIYYLGSIMAPTVYKIDPTGLVAPYAGGAGKLSDSGPALSTSIGYAYCLTLDSLDNLYICDPPNNRVRVVSPLGMMTTIAGNGSLPSGAIQPGPPTATPIGPPTALAIDPKGNLFVYSQRQVTEVDSTGTLQPVAGLNTAPMSSSGDGGWASQATFNSIAGMTFDPSGKLYLSDGGVYLREAIPVGDNGPPPIIGAGGIIGAGASIPPVQSVSPGAIVSIFGSNFYPAGTQHLLTAGDMLAGHLPTVLGGICVTFSGVKAPITGVFPGQINVQVPALPPGPVTVTVTANCGGTNPIAGNLGAVTVDSASPEFFSSPDAPSGRNLIAANRSGAIIEVYGTGWGATIPAIPPGAIPGMAAPLATTPTLMLGGVPIPAANVLYAGISPCCAGLYQVDFTIPDGTPSGQLPLVITIDGIPSPANAYINIQ